TVTGTLLLPVLPVASRTVTVSVRAPLSAVVVTQGRETGPVELVVCVVIVKKALGVADVGRCEIAGTEAALPVLEQPGAMCGVPPAATAHAAPCRPRPARAAERRATSPRRR